MRKETIHLLLLFSSSSPFFIFCLLLIFSLCFADGAHDACSSKPTSSMLMLLARRVGCSWVLGFGVGFVFFPLKFGMNSFVSCVCVD